tara:strand:+ start:17244 stop:17588 length:345 start_codon:yes stop_codon:yes gene_type:complete
MLITAYRMDTEQWRLSRLRQVYEIICIKEPIIKDMLVRLDDHEGALSVFWLFEPKENAPHKDTVERVWSLFNEEYVYHYAPKRLQWWDAENKFRVKHFHPEDFGISQTSGDEED